jgi:hypothetical protein
MAAQLWSSAKTPALSAISTYQGTGGVTSSGPTAPISLPDGLGVLTAIFSSKGTTTTSSVSDVVVMGYLPEGAVVIAGSLVGKSGATATGIKVGLGAAGAPALAGQALDGVFLAATNLSSTRSVTQFGVAGGLPYKVAAISASTYPKNYPVICTVSSGSMTVSLCFSVNLIYTVANQGVL